MNISIAGAASEKKVGRISSRLDRDLPGCGIKDVPY